MTAVPLLLTCFGDQARSTKSPSGMVKRSVAYWSFLRGITKRGQIVCICLFFAHNGGLKLLFLTCPWLLRGSLFFLLNLIPVYPVQFTSVNAFKNRSLKNEICVSFSRPVAKYRFNVFLPARCRRTLQRRIEFNSLTITRCWVNSN